MRSFENPLMHAHAEYGDAQVAPAGRGGTPIDMHRVLRTGDVPQGVNGPRLRGQIMDVASWLPYAAERLCISTDMRDYVLVPTLIFATEIPNANLCAFPFDEMSAWNTQAGELSYRTWRRKPTHVEHANNDPSQARGCIFDASMRPMPEYAGGLHRVVLLNGWDRARDSELAARISAGRTGFSMGAWVSAYHCSCCGADIHRANGGLGCEHFHPRLGPRMMQERGRLVYRIARGVTGFECSSVATPAFRQAMAEPIGMERPS